MKDEGIRTIMSIVYRPSKTGLKAAEEALRLAKICNAKMYLLFVMDVNEYVSRFERVSLGGYVPHELREKGEAIARKIVHKVRGEGFIETIVEVGEPVETALDVVETKDVDIVVLGLSGEDPLGNILRGSVKKHLINELQCNVLLVK